MVDANPGELAEWALRLLEKLRATPLLRNVASDQQTGGLLADVVIDRDQAGRLGVLPQTIDDTLYDAFGQRQASTIYTQQKQYPVFPAFAPPSPPHPAPPPPLSLPPIP